MGGTLGGAGADGLSPNIELAFPNSISQRPTFDQPTIEALLKERMKTSNGWNTAHASGFAGLPAGTPLTLGVVAKIAEQITGIPVSTWVTQWQADPTVANLSVQMQDALAKLFTVMVNLQSMFGALNFLDPDFDIENSIQIWVDGIATIGGLLGLDSPLNSLNLFNLVPPDLMAQISASNIGTYVTNLVTDPNFLDAASFSGQDIWFPRTSEGHGGTGAAYTTANGTTKELLGNLIQVSQDQVLPIKAKAKWAGLTGTGTPIQLAVTGYTDTGSSVQAIISQHNTTPPTTDWIDFAGNYTVPANVVAIRTRLVVAATATAGEVWFSKVNVTKVGPMLQRLIAGTDAGQILTDDISNLFTGIITNTIGLTGKAGLTDFNNLLSTIGGSFGDDLAAAEDRLNDFLHSLSTLNADNINTGEIADQFVPGLSTIHDAIVTAVGNLSGGGFNIDKMLEVLRGQTHAVVDTSSTLVGMFSRLSHAESKLASLPVSLGGTGVGISYGGVVGATDTDEFERVSTASLGPTWLQFYSTGGGVWATPNGHDAEYMWSGTSDREFICVRNNPDLPRSLTDYQRVTSVLSAKATRHYDSILGTFNYCGHNDVWLRISDATTSLANVTGIRIRWGADGSLSIVRFLAGTPFTLKSYGTGSIAPPGPGAVLIGEAGDMNGGDVGRRYFRGIIGNSIRIEVTETGVASGFGATFRRWGHGGRVEGWSGLFDNGQERPGTLHHWNGMDQVFA